MTCSICHLRIATELEMSALSKLKRLNPAKFRELRPRRCSCPAQSGTAETSLAAFFGNRGITISRRLPTLDYYDRR